LEETAAAHLPPQPRRPAQTVSRSRCRIRSRQPPEPARSSAPPRRKLPWKTPPRQGKKFAGSSRRKQAGWFVLQQPVNVLAVRRLVEGAAIAGEMCDREREQARSNRFRKFFRGHPAHDFPSIQIRALRKL